RRSQLRRAPIKARRLAGGGGGRKPEHAGVHGVFVGGREEYGPAGNELFFGIELLVAIGNVLLPPRGRGQVARRAAVGREGPDVVAIVDQHRGVVGGPARDPIGAGGRGLVPALVLKCDRKSGG